MAAHKLCWPWFIKFGQKLGWPSPKIWQPKNNKILARFLTNLRLDRKYLQNATKHWQSENSVANYEHSRTDKLNLVYFGPQTAKNRTGALTHPTGGHQAGHCHASSPCLYDDFNSTGRIIAVVQMTDKWQNQITWTLLSCSAVCWDKLSLSASISCSMLCLALSHMCSRLCTDPVNASRSDLNSSTSCSFLSTTSCHLHSLWRSSAWHASAAFCKSSSRSFDSSSTQSFTASCCFRSATVSCSCRQSASVDWRSTIVSSSCRCRLRFSSFNSLSRVSCTATVDFSSESCADIDESSFFVLLATSLSVSPWWPATVSDPDVCWFFSCSTNSSLAAGCDFRWLNSAVRVVLSSCNCDTNADNSWSWLCVSMSVCCMSVWTSVDLFNRFAASATSPTAYINTETITQATILQDRCDEILTLIHIIRSTRRSRPKKADLDVSPSVHMYIRPSVHKKFLIQIKFGM